MITDVDPANASQKLIKTLFIMPADSNSRYRVLQLWEDGLERTLSFEHGRRHGNWCFRVDLLVLNWDLHAADDQKIRTMLCKPVPIVPGLYKSTHYAGASQYAFFLKEIKDDEVTQANRVVDDQQKEFQAREERKTRPAGEMSRASGSAATQEE